MRKILAAAACLALVALCSAAALAQALTGEMTNTQYLVGTWDCSVTVMVPGSATRQEDATLTFAAVPGNALSQTIVSPMFSSVGFLGYSPQLKKFFSNTVDNMGGTSMQTADRGTPGRIIFNGTSMQGGQTVSSRDTDDKISDTKIRAVSEINLGGNWTKVADASCTKR